MLLKITSQEVVMPSLPFRKRVILPTKDRRLEYAA
jgi:hypothetical protein